MLIHAVLVVVAAILVTQATVLATTIYLHRALAHRALVVHPLLDWMFRAVLWLSTGMRRQEWVAVHRKHHAFTDQEGDPHSPRLMGFWSVQLGNVFLYLKEDRNPDVLERYFRLAYRAFYGRRDVLWGLAKTLVGEPRFLRRVATYARVGARDWLLRRPEATAPA